MKKIIIILFVVQFIMFFKNHNVGITNNTQNSDYNSNNYITEVTIGNGGNFENLTSSSGLFNAINSGSLTGSIIAKIKNDLTETCEKNLSRRANDYNLTILPIDNNIKTISGGSVNGLIIFEGADNVNIDGRYNGNGSYLIFRNTYSTGSSSPTILLYSGASHNTVRNCILEGNHSNGVLKIDVGGTYGNINNLFSNNVIRNRSDGNYGSPDNLVYSTGLSSEVPNDNNILSNNDLFNFNSNAIFCSSTGNKNWTISNNYIHQQIEPTNPISCIYLNSKGMNIISGNIIGNIDVSRNVTAITISDVENAAIYRNKIFSICNSVVHSNTIYGVNILGKSNSSNFNVKVFNNFISLIPADNSYRSIYGIRDRGSSGNNVSAYNNSVYIGGISSGDSNSWAYFRQNGCPTTSTIKNNIFFNGRTGGSSNHFAIGDESAGTGTFAVANNLYVGLGSTPRNFFDRTNSTTATPRDSNYWITNTGDYYSYLSVSTSITASYLFNDISTGDLSIKNSNSICWAVNGKGVSLSDITEDFFGNSRTTTQGVPTDIGAHEFETSTEPPPISLTPVTGDNNFNYLGRTLATINFSQSGTLPSSISLKYYSGVQPPNSNSNCIKSYWVFTPAGGNGYNYSLKLNTVPSEHNQIPSNTFKIAKSNDNGNTWSIIPGTISGNSITITGQTSFSHFTVTSNDTPFPIKLLYLKNSVNKNNLRLQWQTSEELNNSGFEIERKSGNENWSKIGFVKGNNKPSEYYFEDKYLSTGIYHYRLKQIDYNGNFEYFELNNIIEIGKPEKFELSQNYPNPFNAKTVINWQIPKSGYVSIKIYDITGKEIYTLVNGYKEAGYYATNLDASMLSSGIYFYRMVSGNFSKTEKLLLIK